MTTRRFVLILIVGLGLLPLVGYQLRVAGTSKVSVAQAVTILTDRAQDALLVDVRSHEQYADGHPEGAANLPAANLPKVQSLEQLSPELRQRMLVLVDGSGWHSAAAAKALRRLGKTDVVWIEGGMQAWQAYPPAGHPLTLVTTGPAARPATTFRLTSGLEQLLIGLSWIIVKPLYVVLALVVAIRLRRASTPEWLAVRWACLLLVLAEVAGALAGRSEFMEYLHTYGVVLACAAAGYAVIEFIDRRLTRPADGEFCDACTKYMAGEACGMRRMLLLAVPMLIVLAILPLTAPLHEQAYATWMFDKPYAFLREGIQQVYEARFLPAAGIVLLLWVLLRLRRKGHPVQRTRILLAGAIGAIGFAWFRGMLLAMFEQSQAWYDIWQQVIGLCFVLMVMRIVRTFRGATQPPAATEP